jgi:inhibitor of KinA sporulation pathway (predicted exonuclease)
VETTPSHYLVIDVEATTDENNRTVPRNQMEIIEIGAVLVDARTLEPEADFQTFVKPVRHSRLTELCTKLTTITQRDVDGAPRFPEAIEHLRRFVDGRDALFCSWGQYDRNQFEQDASYHRVTLPFRNRHLNLKEQFSVQLGESRRHGMDGALRRVGLSLAGTHHRGIDDARNIARLLPWVLGRVPAPRSRSDAAPTEAPPRRSAAPRDR